MRPEIFDTALRFRPDADIRVLGEGQLAIAVLVDGIVLRFPRSDYARERLRTEVGLLEHIRARLEHSLPDIVAVELDAPRPRAFVAHRLLPGAALVPGTVEQLPDRRVARIADATASFLRDLHALDPAGLSVPRLSNRELTRSFMSEASRWLRPRMNDEQWRRLETELKTLASLSTDRTGLCHTDIGGNILYDEETESVAFIDFGSAIVADPVLDVASLSVLGPRFVANCADRYGLVGERLEDARIVRATFHLQDALYGARQDDWDYVDAILSSY